jgi:hypothetical protein
MAWKDEQLEPMHARYETLPGAFVASMGAAVVAATAFAWWYLDYHIEARFDPDQLFGAWHAIPRQWVLVLGLTAATLVLLALLGALYWTRAFARRRQLPMWNRAAKRALLAFVVPCVWGAAFALVLLGRFQLFGLVAPISLLFPGIGLMLAAPHSHRAFSALGAGMALLGLMAAWFPRESLPFWALGFGIFPFVTGLAIALRQHRQAPDR